MLLPIRQQLMSRVSIAASGCWLWLGSKKRPPEHPYGVLVRFGKKLYTHRVSWEIHNGSIPKGMSVLHKCDVPNCINPDHLFLGTQDDNMKDMCFKGRHALGADTSMSRLTPQQVIDIRTRAQAGEKCTTLAPEFNVSRATILRTIRRECWAHIP